MKIPALHPTPPDKKMVVALDQHDGFHSTSLLKQQSVGRCFTQVNYIILRQPVFALTP